MNTSKNHVEHGSSGRLRHVEHDSTEDRVGHDGVHLRNRVEHAS